MNREKRLRASYREKKRNKTESDGEDLRYNEEQQLDDMDYTFSNRCDDFDTIESQHINPTDIGDAINSDDDDDDDDEQILPPPQNSEILYEGSTKTRQDFVFDFLTLIRSHNLSDAAAKSILKFSQDYCPPNNKIPKTLKSVHNCLKLASPNGIICSRNSFCQKCGEESCECKDSSIAHFAGFNIVNQIVPILKGVSEKLTILPKNCKPLTFLFYVDGGKYAKSGKYEAWPLLATICELPSKLRQSQRNHIFLGIMYCIGKPNWGIMCKFLKSKFSLGTVIVINDQQYHLWGTGLICDLPARASLLNIVGPNGYHACCQCTVVGEYFQKRVIYPPGDYILRTSADIEKAQELAVKQNQHKKAKTTYEGIKGPNELNDILKIPDAVTADLMHTGFAGPVLQTVEKIYNGFKGEIIIKALTKDQKELLNQIICNVRWPCEMKRKLRPLSDMSLYKTSEWKLLTYFVIPTVLSAIMGTERKEESSNLMHLVAAIIVLSKKQITQSDIEHAKDLLDEWHKKLGDTFDDTSYTFKAHDILHFPQQVANHGPLPGHSAFAGENMIGFIGKQISCYGNEVAVSQICQRIDTVFRLRQIDKYVKPQKMSEFKEISQKIKNHLRTTLPNAVAYEWKKIRGTILRCATSDEPEPNSIILFMHENQLKCGIIKAILKSNNIFYLVVKSLNVEKLCKLYSEDYSLLANEQSWPEYSYFKNEQKFNDELITVEEKSVLHKAVLISAPKITFIVPLLTLFEHN
uniref:Transposase domain-containing protein n=1 Tax=Panagrolaimus davidi TaxID=227884 RepID=A0A914PUK1_9BILA